MGEKKEQGQILPQGSLFACSIALIGFRDEAHTSKVMRELELVLGPIIEANSLDLNMVGYEAGLHLQPKPDADAPRN
jgi:hypothetical protein